MFQSWEPNTYKSGSEPFFNIWAHQSKTEAWFTVISANVWNTIGNNVCKQCMRVQLYLFQYHHDAINTIHANMFYFHWGAVRDGLGTLQIIHVLLNTVDEIHKRHFGTLPPSGIHYAVKHPSSLYNAWGQ